MNVTEGIVRDLHVLVRAGEASADSRALVEEWLARDPALAAELAREQDWRLPTAPPPPADAERLALRRTQHLLGLRTWSLGLALFFTGLPLSFVFDDHGLRFLMLPGHVTLASISLALGVVSWIAHARARTSLKPRGF